jgi:flagellar biosynthesis chaperone FliJ
MPDPTTLSVQDLENLAAQAKAAASANTELSATGKFVQDMLKGFGTSMDEASTSLNSNTDVLTRNAAAFGVLTSAIFKARESFKGFEGFDTSSLNTFTKQIDGVFKVFEMKGTALGEVLSTLNSAGIKVPAAFSTSLEVIHAFAKQLAASADNAIRLQGGLFRMSAETGSLGKLVASAGSEYQNMNNILSTHQSMIDNTGQALRMSSEDVEKYYSELGRVPGALQSTVTSSRDANEQIGMLSATIAYSIGSGRDYKDVIIDLKDAYKNMGITGEPALKFSARIGELSNKFGIELDVVKQSLRDATTSLKNYGGEGLKTGAIIEGSIRIMNNYTQALKNTGVSGATAVGMIQNMTNQITSLDVAQRAFLSQQSGGPGGLRGAFKVERMIREGNIDQVMEDVQKSMQKQFGKIVSTKEAEGSESAASRAIMQRQMLMQGPLGAFAKDEQGAARILEAFSQRSEGKISETGLSDVIVQTTMDQGLKFQELTATHLNVIRGIMEAQKGVVGVTNLGLLQHTSTVRSGTRDYMDQPRNEERERSREYLTRTANTAEQRATQRAQRVGSMNVSGGQTWATDSGQGNANRNLREALNDWGGFMKEVPNFLKGSAQSLMNVVTSGKDKTKQYSEELRRVQANVDSKRKEAGKTKDIKKKERLLDEATAGEALLNTFDPNNDRSVLSPASKLQDTTKQQVRTPGQTVGAATQQSANLASPVADKDKSGKTAPSDAKGARAANDVTGEVHVHITGYCLACGERIKDSDHKRAVLPA